MRGQGAFNPVAAALLQRNTEQQFRTRWRNLCWACLKDKPVTGGSVQGPIRAHAVRRFTCRECLEKKAAEGNQSK